MPGAILAGGVILEITQGEESAAGPGLSFCSLLSSVAGFLHGKGGQLQGLGVSCWQAAGRGLWYHPGQCGPP